MPITSEERTHRELLLRLREEKGEVCADELRELLERWLAMGPAPCYAAQVFGQASPTLRSELLERLPSVSLSRDFWRAWWALRLPGHAESLMSNPGFTRKAATSLAGFLFGIIRQASRPINAVDAADWLGRLRGRAAERIESGIARLEAQEDLEAAGRLGDTQGGLAACLLAAGEWPNEKRKELWARIPSAGRRRFAAVSERLCTQAPLAGLAQEMILEFGVTPGLRRAVAGRADVWRSSTLVRELLRWQDPEVLERMLGSLAAPELARRVKQAAESDPLGVARYLEREPERLRVIPREVRAQLLHTPEAEARLLFIRLFARDEELQIYEKERVAVNRGGR